MIELLYQILIGKIKHNYNGTCPDDLDMYSRDIYCPACQILLQYEKENNK